jgi:hypothetical protein
VNSTSVLLVFEMGKDDTVTIGNPQHVPRVGDIICLPLLGPWVVRSVTWRVRQSLDYDIHVKLAPASVAEALGLAEDGKR